MKARNDLFNYVSDLPYNATIDLPFDWFESFSDRNNYIALLIDSGQAQMTRTPSGERTLTKL